jgi:uncharacterized protein (UPF0333 family)
VLVISWILAAEFELLLLGLVLVLLNVVLYTVCRAFASGVAPPSPACSHISPLTRTLQTLIPIVFSDRRPC